MDIFEIMKKNFKTVFNSNYEKLYFSPGRVNLIGEHIDYNGGFVFPCAISLGTYAAVKSTKENHIRAFSLNFEKAGLIEVSLNNLTFKKEDSWTNYIKGVVKYIKEAGYKVNHGFDILVYGNLPNGSGLSSSASLEMLIGKILIDLFELPLNKVDLALLGKKVENEFIGVNSGIMDQFAISLGKESKAIKLDCNTLDFEYVPINFENESIIIMNTNKRRELADSKYNERRSQCEAALMDLKNNLKISSLCELTVEDFHKHSSLIKDEINKNRAFHAITENERVKRAIIALKNDDLTEFGNLMTASHVSLKNYYEVTGIELDTLVEGALNQPGVLGARMTGAGFGGCAIALVKNNCIEKLIENVGNLYEGTIGYKASFYIASTSEGPSLIESIKI